MTEESQALHRLVTDHAFFAEQAQRIRTLDPTVRRWVRTPLHLNTLQRRFNGCWFALEAAGRPVRIYLMKSRKDGASTNIQSVSHWMGATRPETEVVTIAHRDGSAQKIAAIMEGFNAHLPEPLRPLFGATPGKHGLVWANGSSTETQTARSDDASRSGSPSILHLSEAAFYAAQRAKTSAEDMMQATLGAVDDVAGTAILTETTSRGPSGPFYDRWMRGVAGGTQGELTSADGWTRIFFGWADSAKYAFELSATDRAAEDDFRRCLAANDPDGARRAIEPLGYGRIWYERARDFQLTPPQVRWALRKVAAFNGNVGRFDREYPLSWQIAFASGGGRTVFPAEVLGPWRDAMGQPPPEGTRRGGLFLAEPPGRLSEGDHWEIFEPPVPGHDYVAGIDPSGGTGYLESEGDDRDDRGSDANPHTGSGAYAAIYVHDRHTGRQVAQMYSKTVLPDDCGTQAVRAGLWYNHAMLVFERNNHGTTAIRRALDLGYSRLYRERTRSGRAPRAGAGWLRMYGFSTTLATRTPLIDQFVAVVRAGRAQPQSRAFFREAMGYLYDAEDRPYHLPGQTDDALLSGALALQGDLSLPPVVHVRPSDPPEPTPLAEALRAFRQAARRGGSGRQPTWARSTTGGY